MRRNLIQDEAIVKDAAAAQPAAPSLDFRAPPDSLGNAAAEGRGSPGRQPRPGTTPRSKTRRKPKAVHWEAFLQSSPGFGRPEG
jgi:hypothetical protein